MKHGIFPYSKLFVDLLSPLVAMPTGGSLCCAKLPPDGRDGWNESARSVEDLRGRNGRGDPGVEGAGCLGCSRIHGDVCKHIYICSIHHIVLLRSIRYQQISTNVSVSL